MKLSMKYGITKKIADNDLEQGIKELSYLKVFGFIGWIVGRGLQIVGSKYFHGPDGKPKIEDIEIIRLLFKFILKCTSAYIQSQANNSQAKGKEYV